MSTLDKKIITYLSRTPNFETEVELKDDGQGAYIKEWNATDKPKPTDAEVNDLEDKAQTITDNAIAVANRQKEYGSP